MFRLALSITVVLWVGLSVGQINESFVDGEIFFNPTWSGDTARFEVDQNQWLHLNAPSQADRSYLSTPCFITDSARWSFDLKLGFNPSSYNYSRILLTANHASPDSVTAGLLVEVGRSTDGLSIKRRLSNSDSLLFHGNNWVNQSSNTVNIEVNHRVDDWWHISLNNGTNTQSDSFYYPIEDALLSELSASTSPTFILQCVYTSSRSDKFWFDNIVVEGHPPRDEQAPEIVELTPIPQQHLLIEWNEKVDSLDVDQFTLDSIHQALELFQNELHTILKFDFRVDAGAEYTLFASDISDTSGNSTDISTSFRWPLPIEEGSNLVLSELMPKPLDDETSCEFVELYNKGDQAVEIAGLSIADKTRISTIPPFVIKAKGFFMLADGCAQNFDQAINISPWPTLNNGGDSLRLLDSTFVVLDEMGYESCSEGISIERINPNIICFDQSNWIHCQHPTGSTPEQPSFVWADTIDLQGPTVINSTSLTPLEHLITLNEPAAYVVPWTIWPMHIRSYYWDSPSELRVFSDSLTNESANLQLNLSDCQGNSSEQHVELCYGRAARPLEVLFTSYCFDCDTPFVSIVNRTNHWLNLRKTSFISNHDTLLVSLATLKPNAQVKLNPSNFDKWRTPSGDQLILFTNNVVIDRIPVLEGEQERYDINQPCAWIDNWSNHDTTLAPSTSSIFKGAEFVVIEWNWLFDSLLIPEGTLEGTTTTFSTQSEHITLVDCEGDTFDYWPNYGPDPPSVIFSELMYDHSEHEYIELYVVEGPQNLRELQLRVIDDDTASYDLVDENLMANSGDIILLCDDWSVAECSAITLDLPPSSLANEGRRLELIDLKNRVIDVVNYSDSLHHSSIESPRSKALERISPHGGAGWTTATEESGFASPACSNSHWKSLSIQPNGKLSIAYRDISPNNDGHHDYPIILYSEVDEGSTVVADIISLEGMPSNIEIAPQAIRGDGYLRLSGIAWEKLPKQAYILNVRIVNERTSTSRFAFYIE